MALIEEGASEGHRKLLEACCQFDPDKRPTAQVVVRDIAAIQKATKQTRKAVPRSMQHHDEVLRLLADFVKLKEDQQRLARAHRNRDLCGSLLHSSLGYFSVNLTTRSDQRSDGGVGAMKN